MARLVWETGVQGEEGTCVHEKQTILMVKAVNRFQPLKLVKPQAHYFKRNMSNYYYCYGRRTELLAEAQH